MKKPHLLKIICLEQRRSDEIRTGFDPVMIIYSSITDDCLRAFFHAQNACSVNRKE